VSCPSRYRERKFRLEALRAVHGWRAGCGRRFRLYFLLLDNNFKRDAFSKNLRLRNMNVYILEAIASMCLRGMLLPVSY
jgi:hypothetical protein